MAHFREHWYPGLFERADYSGWRAAGGKSLGQRAAERVGEILAQHKPTPLPENVASAVHAIVERAAAGDASASDRS